MSDSQPGGGLPLVDLFLQLRDADLPLGIDEYRALLRALQLGFGTQDTTALRRLCLALWIKTPEEQRIFDYHFEQMLRQQEAAQVEAVARGETASRQEPAQAVEHPAALPSAEQHPSPASSAPALQPTQPESSSAQPTITGLTTPSRPSPAGFIPTLGDEVQVARLMRAAMLNGDVPHRRYLISEDYFPVTRRQMKQCWRYLRRMAKEGPAVVLNVEETIKAISRRGVLLEPVMEPLRTNRTQLLLLVDQDGSMTPFHQLARRLVETAERGGRLGKTGVYYFHNCPQDFLYLTSSLIEAQEVQTILSHVHRERTVILVFSDAGAARGGLSPERVEQTRGFISRVNGAVRRVAWLNPMPNTRWRGTTAAEISRFVPMFELSRIGMESAMDELRGRHAHIYG
jgi:uncharacterized protein with von Willebrand factor type A (vWA) domain